MEKFVSFDTATYLCTSECTQFYEQNKQFKSELEQIQNSMKICTLRKNKLYAVLNAFALSFDQTSKNCISFMLEQLLLVNAW